MTGVRVSPTQRIVSLPAQSESDFQRKVVTLARIHHWRTFHPWLSVRSPSGFPDLVLIRKPRVIFAELKSATGTFTPDQLAWLVELEQCPGVETYRWRPGDWPRISEVLQR